MAKHQIINETKITFPSYSANEAFARSVAASFCAQLNPTFDELSDIKCAVSEAVTNAIVHGYREHIGDVQMILRIYENRVFRAEIKDKGCGIGNIEEAMRPRKRAKRNGIHNNRKLYGLAEGHVNRGKRNSRDNDEETLTFAAQKIIHSVIPLKSISGDTKWHKVKAHILKYRML